MQKYITILFLLSSFFLNAQEFFWEDHLPYSNVIKLDQSNSKVYCATPYAVFIYDKSEKTITKLSKANGLSDVGVSTIAYHKQTNNLFVGYTNGNLDIINENAIQNYPFIKEKIITASKAINTIYFINDKAFIATGYGISVYDINQSQITTSYFIGTNNTYQSVNDIEQLNNYIYAATDSGLFYADTTTDLSDFNNWKIDTNLIIGKINVLVKWGNDLWANYSSTIYNGDTCYIFSGGNWKIAPASVSRNIYSLQKGLSEVISTMNGVLLTMQKDGFYKQQFAVGEPKFAIQDNNDSTVFWVATTFSGLIKIQNTVIVEYIIPDGPSKNRVWEFDVKNTKLASVPGAYNSALNNIYHIDGLSIFKEAGWKTFNGADDIGFDTLFDIIDVKFSPTNDEVVYLASWGRGLVEFSNGKIKNVYNNQNSSIQSRSAYRWFGIGGVTFDKNGNLWCTNSYVSTSHLNMKNPIGNWFSFNLSPAINDGYGIGKVIIDAQENKWVLLSKYGKIVVFNENGTLLNATDDSLKEITSLINEGNLPGSFPGTLTFDKNGTAWVGTNDGIAYLENAENIFKLNKVNFKQVFIDGDSLQGAFLKGENITDIEVTNTNQKWVATIGKGLYLMNEDMSKVIFHFSENNSPLFANDILAIKQEPLSGKLFISTSYGVMSLKIEDEKIYKTLNNAILYPNPLNMAFNQWLTIDKLPKNTIITIADVSGKVVQKLTPNNSKVIWDLTDFSGNKVKSGIYLFYFIDEKNKQQTIKKLLLAD